MDRNPYTHFFWFRQVLLDHFGEFEITNFPGMTTEEAFTRYMVWAIKHRFLHTFGNPEPVAGIILRPVNDDQLKAIMTDYYKNVLEYDLSSDLVWIDFMHAPRNYPFMIDFVSKTGYERMAWVNAKRGKLHIMPIENMSRTHPLADETWDENTLVPIQL